MFIDRQKVECMADLVRAVVENIEAFPEVSVNEQIHVQLLDWARAGDLWAETALESCALAGIKQHVDAYSRTFTAKVVDAQGVEDNLPLLVDAAFKREDGTIEHAKAPWETLDRTRYERFIRRLLKTADTMSRRGHIHEGVLMLWDRVPQAKSAGDACRLSGHDPRQLRFDEIEEAS